ncbi:DUF2306 domain-containing protein [Aeromicrobium sp.]|uniref:DUF2306 domain-containing protein n=1 Tax=Aeromicrobium sp. TaxID=1871063 RepID=UPI003D6AD204
MRRQAGRRSGSSWVPASLVALGLVPIVAGSVRLVELAGGPQVLPARSDPSSVPLIVHIVSVIVYAVLGAFQFSARLRMTGWHRNAGRMLVVAGPAVALSAIWMTLFYPRTEGGDLLYLFRLQAASGMLASIVLGVMAIRRRDIVRHRAWMIRAYAIALGAGTQVFTLGFGKAIIGSSDLSIALLQGAAWVINLAVAELFIRRRSVRRPARTVVPVR